MLSTIPNIIQMLDEVKSGNCMPKNYIFSICGFSLDATGINRKNS